MSSVLSWFSFKLFFCTFVSICLRKHLNVRLGSDYVLFNVLAIKTPTFSTYLSLNETTMCSDRLPSKIENLYNSTSYCVALLNGG